MAKGKIAVKNPAVQELDAGTYFWCACGESSRQPLCSGAHAGTEFTPLKFEIAEKKKVALCQCKQTNNPPFCDGSHANL